MSKQWNRWWYDGLFWDVCISVSREVSDVVPQLSAQTGSLAGARHPSTCIAEQNLLPPPLLEPINTQRPGILETWDCIHLDPPQRPHWLRVSPPSPWYVHGTGLLVLFRFHPLDYLYFVCLYSDLLNLPLQVHMSWHILCYSSLFSDNFYSSIANLILVIFSHVQTFFKPS